MSRSHRAVSQAVAARLHLSESTVKSHLRSAETKLAIGSRAALAVLVDRGRPAPLIRVTAAMVDVTRRGDQPADRRR